MNASFFVPFSAKLRQSETCFVLMIPCHPLARTSFVIRSRMTSAIICSGSLSITGDVHCACYYD